jgi:hypothetical protein
VGVKISSSAWSRSLGWDFDPDLDVDHAIGAIQDHVAGVERAAHDWVADTQEWGKVAKARIEAQRKTEKA